MAGNKSISPAPLCSDAGSNGVGRAAGGLVGTKNGAGVWQRIVSLIPPHRVYIEPFFGRGSVMRHMRSCEARIGIDLDPAAIDSGEGLALMFKCCGLQWLKDYFGMKASAAGFCVADRAATFCGASWSEHVVYLDPPYLINRNYYANEFSPAMHLALLAVFKALPCPALLSGYKTPMYDDALPCYPRVSIPTVNRRGKRINEIVWMNYPPPSVLHDVRFIGGNRRQRERIRRRVTNWRASFLQLAPLERQAMLEALAAASSDAAGGVARSCGDSC